MRKTRSEELSAIRRAREDLDRALSSLEALDAEDRKRVSYSVHALNNYLMVVATSIHLLRARAQLIEDRESRRLLDSIKHATQLMMSTARGVLTATPDVLPPLLFEPASLTEIAKEVCGSYREISRRKRVRIAWRSPVRRDLVVTDRVAAGAVLDNLLSNAIKYSHVGTSVLVTISVRPEDVACFVRDYGPGLSEADQAKMFQRGVKLSARPTAGESSTGYGLAIANDLTKALGGSLSCTSVLGEGSCFTFALPLAEPGSERRASDRPRLTLE
ncbi:MAG TPA: HAMP domain-containing sensor histidine kinase [Thermoanaerobaculia bacterium]|nr:HAMP domain-containing sensor histidine kinase [Thermoanaerobaculia bacterium]